MKSINKVFVLLVALITVISVNAQTEAGKYLFGGSSELSFAAGGNKIKNDGESEDGPKTFSLTFSPDMGFFVINNLAAGLRFDIEFSKEKMDEEISRTTILAVGPFVRYYVGQNKNKPFAEVMVGVGQMKETYEDGEYDEVGTTNMFAFGAGLGTAFFLNDNVSLDLMLGYSNATAKDKVYNDVKFITSAFTFNIGFSIVL